MKKLIIIAVIVGLALTIALSGNALANESDPALPDPGITPDNPFYFLDNWSKQISLAFTFNAENKALKALDYADERLAEIQEMINRNKIKAAEKAANGYDKYLENAEENMERANRQGEFSEALALRTQKQLECMEDCPYGDEASETLMTGARERAMTSRDNAVRNMAQENPGKAASLNLEIMERQLTRIQANAGDPGIQTLQAKLDNFNRMVNLGEEVSQIAHQIGEGGTVDQVVATATQHHLDVLAEIEETVPEQARTAIQTAINNCEENQAQLLNRLQTRNQTGNDSEDTITQDSHTVQPGQAGKGLGK